MKSVKALCFDLDDTLRDSSGHDDTIRRTCDDVAAATGLDAAQLLLANGEVWACYWPEVEDRWTLGGLTGEAVTTEAWRRTLEVCGRSDASLVRIAAEAHLRHAHDALRLFEDARQLLEALDPGLALAVITNGASDTQRGTLRTLGIEARFEAIVVSGEVGVAKPDAAIFAMALDQLGVPAQHAWHIGDNHRTDVAGARSAGLTAVWLNRDGADLQEVEGPPDYEIGSLSELPALISARPTSTR